MNPIVESLFILTIVSKDEIKTYISTINDGAVEEWLRGNIDIEIRMLLMCFSARQTHHRAHNLC